MYSRKFHKGNALRNTLKVTYLRRTCPRIFSEGGVWWMAMPNQLYVFVGGWWSGHLTFCQRQDPEGQPLRGMLKEQNSRNFLTGKSLMNILSETDLLVTSKDKYQEKLLKGKPLRNIVQDIYLRRNPQRKSSKGKSLRNISIERQYDWGENSRVYLEEKSSRKII